ncbi:hypothetical protein LTR65_005765 [Meristemomyces frigidus]
MTRMRLDACDRMASDTSLVPLGMAMPHIRAAGGGSNDDISTLRDDTRNLFYHGYNNYMAHAFPEDELKPISCKPQTRNRDNPADIGLNDVLGNYSVTLVDSLSTLAILASDEDTGHAGHALKEFQAGVKALVDLYGDGTEKGRCGSRACGFDLDSKVQVFETNIRGVGGLLSAHLFAAGDLPIRGYTPVWEEDGFGNRATDWRDGFVYDGQLLRLAHDLASRLLPAFNTPTGLPYPRVNLRHGIPFYRDALEGFCRVDGTSSDPREITETCSAGAGSLVLEFTTLSRLTGDPRFEALAKRAFWAVWERRSAIGLIGGGIDAESGQWTIPPLAGIGAGIDSFYEYALKSHILLSGLPYNATPTSTTTTTTNNNNNNAPADPNSPDAFLHAWQTSHAAIRRHISRRSTSTSGFVQHHPYYGQADLVTGAPRYSWIDNLSAYYPGLLALAGEVAEAAEAHLVYAALWTRYSALPERWNVGANGISNPAFAEIEPHFRHWAGRPEFIESTYYLYQATQDPWYLHTGEMTLRDIRRRCWTPCGWADLGDVVSGAQRDRMESFFLGETAKYLYLLFSKGHPLNGGDGAVVFTTEGHPLVVPRGARGDGEGKKVRRWQRKWGPRDEARRDVESAGQIEEAREASEGRIPTVAEAVGRRPGKVAPDDQRRHDSPQPAPTCPAPPPPLPLTISHVANRADLFHAAALAQLHLVPVNPARSSPLLAASSSHGDAGGPGISFQDVRSPSNYTFYPWTLPQSLIPPRGTSAPMRQPVISTLTFPNLEDAAGGGGGGGGTAGMIALGALQKVWEGVLINSLSNIRLNMVQEPKSPLLLPGGDEGGLLDQQQQGDGGGAAGEAFRIHGIANWALGKDEKVLLSRQALEGVSPADPHFTRVRDLEMVDLVVDVPVRGPAAADEEEEEEGIVMDIGDDQGSDGEVLAEWEVEVPENSTMESLWSELESLFSGLLASASSSSSSSSSHDETSAAKGIAHPALTPIGIGDNAGQAAAAAAAAAPTLTRQLIPAILPTGAGAAPLPASMDLPETHAIASGALPFQSIFYLDSTLCAASARLPHYIAKSYNILVIKRGECSFGDKLAKIPSLFAPSPSSGEGLQLVVVLSVPESQGPAEQAKPEGELIRPLLDEAQRTPGGLERRQGIPMVMVDGRAEVAGLFRRVATAVGYFDASGKLVVVEEEEEGGAGQKKGATGPGVGVKRRYWFESLGVPIGNLILL